MPSRTAELSCVITKNAQSDIKRSPKEKLLTAEVAKDNAYPVKYLLISCFHQFSNGSVVLQSYSTKFITKDKRRE